MRRTCSWLEHVRYWKTLNMIKHLLLVRHQTSNNHNLSGQLELAFCSHRTTSNEICIRSFQGRLDVLGNGHGIYKRDFSKKRFFANKSELASQSASAYHVAPILTTLNHLSTRQLPHWHDLKLSLASTQRPSCCWLRHESFLDTNRMVSMILAMFSYLRVFQNLGIQKTKMVGSPLKTWLLTSGFRNYIKIQCTTLWYRMMVQHSI